MLVFVLQKLLSLLALPTLLAFLVVLGLYTVCKVEMGDMGLKIYHDISGIYCDNDINDDNLGNPVSLEKSIIFPIFTPNRVL